VSDNVEKRFETLNLSKSESYLRLHTWKSDPWQRQEVVASANGPDRFWSTPGLRIKNWYDIWHIC